MKLELKHLAGYLPYGLQMYLEDSNGVVMDSWTLQPDSVTFSLINQNKPILRPLSDLTKQIEVNGEKFVPVDTDLLGKYEISVIPEFNFFDGCGSNENIDNLPYFVIEQLLEWHFDIYGLIEAGLAIDINTLNK
jgi:hypothetical protein